MWCFLLLVAGFTNGLKLWFPNFWTNGPLSGFLADYQSTLLTIVPGWGFQFGGGSNSNFHGFAEHPRGPWAIVWR